MQIDEIRSLVRVLTSPSTLSLSLSVMRLMECVAPLYGFEAEKGAFTGLLHHLAKDRSLTEMITIFETCNVSNPIPEKWWKEPYLHGPAASILARRQFGIEDIEILEAICTHEIGSQTILSRCLHVASQTEELMRQGIDTSSARKSLMNLAFEHEEKLVRGTLELAERIIYPLQIAVMNQQRWEIHPAIMAHHVAGPIRITRSSIQLR